MGSAVSVNSSKVVVNAISKVASEIVQNSTISESSSQIISVTNVRGDVIISGNIMTQKVNINMTSLLDAMSTEEAQQNLATEIAQQAKALTSGLNIGQLSIASNLLDTLIQASIELVSKIGETCSTTANQFQQIYVKNVIGSVKIENNVQEQVTEILQNCIEKAVSANNVIQDVTTKLSQTASATSAGLSEWALIGLVAVLIGIPVAGGVIGGIAFFKYPFPVLLVLGVVMLIVYFYYTTNSMALDAYSQLIKNTPSCAATVSLENGEFDTPERASISCLANANCAGFDWKGININSDGTYEILTNPQTTFYSRIQNNCSVGKDNVKMVRAPVIFQGTGPPVGRPENSIKGDVYVDLLTAHWYQWDNTGSFQPKGTITHERFNNLRVSGIYPSIDIIGENNDFYVYADPQNPEFWHIYKYDDTALQRWVKQVKTPGPGMFASAPSVTNVSGFKTVQYKNWLLYSGIIALIIGIIGSAYVFFNNKQQSSPNEPIVGKK